MGARSITSAAAERIRALPDRHGRPVLACLCLVVALGLGLRAEAALDPLADPGGDSRGYSLLAQNIYEEGRYGYEGPSGSPARNPTDWSPGAPIFYAATYYLIGGVDPTAARLAVALLGAGMILLVYLLGRRLGTPLLGAERASWAGLAGAALAALYPTFIHNNGRMLSEPIAAFTLVAAVLSFLWVADRERPLWAWLLPGLLLGITALVRPEYLLFGVAFALIALVGVWRERGLGPGAAAASLIVVAFLAPIVPWTARNYVLLDRLVPVSTGSGKALFIGTYLPGDGLHLETKEHLAERARRGDRFLVCRGRRPRPRMTAMLNAVARCNHRGLSRDAALRKVGRRNLRKYALGQPLDFAGMMLNKMAHMWQGSSQAMFNTPARVLQYTILAFGLLGIGLLAWGRRWEAILLAALIGGVTLIGGLLLAGTRRNVTLMPLVFALAGTAAAWLITAVRERGIPEPAGGDDALKGARSPTVDLRPTVGRKSTFDEGRGSA